MPAVIVEDTTALPRVPVPAPGTVRRRVRSVTTAPSGFEGEGFPVRRAFAGVDLRDLDPFIHMDQMGEVEYAPGEPKGTAWHPHRGFETVTYIIDGTFEHADSHGGGGTISNGDTQWMTAGGGVLHIERPPEALVVSGGLFHGLQLWVNLPKAQKWDDPRRGAPGVAHARPRRRRPRRPADPRADRHVRAVRDEHPRGGHGRLHRLPGRPAGQHPRPARPARVGPRRGRPGAGSAGMSN